MDSFHEYNIKLYFISSVRIQILLFQPLIFLNNEKSSIWFFVESAKKQSPYSIFRTRNFYRSPLFRHHFYRLLVSLFVSYTYFDKIDKMWKTFVWSNFILFLYWFLLSCFWLMILFISLLLEHFKTFRTFVECKCFIWFSCLTLPFISCWFFHFKTYSH